MKTREEKIAYIKALIAGELPAGSITHNGVWIRNVATGKLISQTTGREFTEKEFDELLKKESGMTEARNEHQGTIFILPDNGRG